MFLEISVIIPAYNAEKHIQKCLESLQKQTYNNFEAIIVIDGATDNTESIVKAFSESDSRFKAIVQENAGPSKAKNTGMDIASGKYITFMDSDDYIDENHLQLLHDSIENTSLAVCGYINEETDGTSKDSSNIEDGKFEAIEILDKLILSKNEISGSCCNKLYIRDIIEKNKIRFYTGQKYMFEDIMLNYEYLKCISEGLCISKCTYHYVHHPSEGMSRGLTDVESKWMHYTDILDFILADNDERFSDFLNKVKLAKVWHCATAVRVLAHYGKTENEKYKEMHRYIGKNLLRYLFCSVLPIKKRLGGLLTYLFPKLSFAFWDKGR